MTFSILVSGRASYLGSQMVELLAREGHQVSGLANLSREY
jgi:nucleoside-diphosphate-sugar epimerase